jgi:uncharacterized protein (DUF608 family)
MGEIIQAPAQAYSPGPQRTYGREAGAAAFLLGGIGTGNVSLGSRGEFRDWEIFNRPAKGSTLPNTYFCVRAQAHGEPPVTRVLESALRPPHTRSHGYHQSVAAGLPRLADSRLRGEYPLVWIEFEDPDLPIELRLEAFTPLIPLDAEDSGIPGAYLTYRARNVSDRSVDVSIAGCIINPVGEVGHGRFGHPSLPPGGGRNLNEFREGPGFSGFFLRSLAFPPGDLRYGDVSLVTQDGPVTRKPVWRRSEWAHEWLQEFWDDFSSDGKLEDLGLDTPSGEGVADTGSLAVSATLAPGETRDYRFILAWYFPNRLNGWSEQVRVRREGREVARNRYAARFASSWDVAAYLVAHRERLERLTRDFHGALFGSSLPPYVLDAVASNITALRSPTCFRLEDGRFLGYEGCFDDAGCCDGTCTHVWNYAQTAAFLFPALERDMRRTEFLEETAPDGEMKFRARRMFESLWDHQAAADGQLGSVMRVLREWKLSGDDEFLRALWPRVQSALRYAASYWDTDGDLVLDGAQHNTYDIEFYGPNPLTGVFFLGALRAAREMALHLGEEDAAQRYAEAFERSSRRLEELTWNGEYYEQRLDDVDHPYQHGIGCLSDQLLGQQLAHLLGLGYLLPPERVRSALSAVYRHNYRTDFTHHVNCQRTYVLDGEAGLLVCSWPRGSRPRVPFPYSDEVFTGIEYQVAAHLIYEGFLDEGLAIVRAVRDRHDGVRRNPWDEVECGHHYVRSMASWGLLIALSGFQFDLPRGEIAFAPAVNADDFRTFWSTGRAWGTYSQRKDPATGEWDVDVRVLYGDASGLTVRTPAEVIRL